MDVGTNAETVGEYIARFGLFFPTGPAFEGAQISSGQRAVPFAVERIEIDPVTEPRRVIGSDIWSDEDGPAEATAASASLDLDQALSRRSQNCASRD